jgi:uracil phosphoribosyltransferase
LIASIAEAPVANIGSTTIISHIGLYRDPKTLKAVEYFAKLPQDIDEREIIVVDPMLATALRCGN